MECLELRAITRWGKVPAWWLLHPAIDADKFCVLAALATYADDEGFCEPSQATLALRLKRSRPWVNRVIAELTTGCFLEKTMRTRRNGGTTSCRYRLNQIAPDPSATAVTGQTPVCHLADAPRHVQDTNQPVSKQIQETQPTARAAVRQPHEGLTETIEPVAEDWHPSQTAIAKALLVYPEADCQSHAVMFVARCRSKGYRYRPDTLDDTWLAWFIEDQRRDIARRSRGPLARLARPRQRDVGDDRFEAWAIAAGSQPVSATWS